MGRFITEDSYSGKENDPLSLNLYTYCYNNPIALIDDSGNSPVDVFIQRLILKQTTKSETKEANKTSGGFPSFFNGYVDQIPGGYQITGSNKYIREYMEKNDTAYLKGKVAKRALDKVSVYNDFSVSYTKGVFTYTSGYTRLHNLGQGWNAIYNHNGISFTLPKKGKLDVGFAYVPLGIVVNTDRPEKYERDFIGGNVNYNFVGLEVSGWEDVLGSGIMFSSSQNFSISGGYSFYNLVDTDYNNYDIRYYYYLIDNDLTQQQN